MKKINQAFLGLSMLVNGYVTFSLKPSSFQSFVILFLWLSVPASILYYLTLKRPNHFGSSNNAFYASLAIIASGILFYVDIVFINPDPQGAIAVFMLPLFQLIEIGVLSVVFRFIKRRS